MRRLTPAMIALIFAGVLLLALVILLFVRSSGNPDRLSDDQVAANGVAADPEKRCADQATYDRIKRELFRRASALRGSDQSAYDQLVAYAVLRVETPILREHDEETDRVDCSAYLSLDLPPGVAVAGGRRTLNAEVGYSLQPAVDGSGVALVLSNAEPIVTPLATLARTGAAAGDPLDPATAPPDGTGNALAPEPLPDPLSPADPSPADPAPEPTANPSFNCANARTAGEIAVCNSAGLAALDRQMAAQYRGAVAAADPAQRAILQRTRDRFLSYRDGCRSDSCIADAYRGRMAEIRDIMTGRWRPQR